MGRIKKEEEYRLAKENLENALMSLFYTKKLEDIKIKDICEKAGVGVGTFYHYYKNKEQILRERFRHVDKHFLEKVRPVLEKMDFIDSYFGYIESYINVKENRSVEYMRQVYKSYLMDGVDNLNYESREIYILLRDIINKGITSGIIREDVDLDSTSRYLHISLKGFVFQWCCSGDLNDDDKREFSKIFLLGIVKKEYYEKVKNYAYKKDISFD